MAPRDLSYPHMERPFYVLLELLIKLFTLGIFSGEGGAKAWFELILVTAALCASGFILWWQIPLLIAAIFLATISAGIFAVLAPQYLVREDVKACNQIASVLEDFSEHNVSKVLALSGDKLEHRLSQIDKARKILKDNPNLVEQISELQSVFNTLDQTFLVVSEKVETMRKAEEERIQEEIEFRRKEQEAYQNKLKKDAELRVEQERLKQISKKYTLQKDLKQKSDWQAWLREQRKRANFTGGCPPDKRYSPPRCRSGYSIIVTLYQIPLNLHIIDGAES